MKVTSVMPRHSNSCNIELDMNGRSTNTVSFSTEIAGTILPLNIVT